MTTNERSAIYEYDASESAMISGDTVESHLYDTAEYSFSSEHNTTVTVINPGPARVKSWPSRDPIQEEWGLNLYGFVQNGPIHAIDPYGLAWRSCTAADEKKLATGLGRTVEGIDKVLANLGVKVIEQAGLAYEQASYMKINAVQEIRIGKELSDAKKYALKIHEFVGGVFSMDVFGVSEYHPSGVAARRYDGGKIKALRDTVTGTHNLALAFELAALAEGKICPCSFAEERLGSAHVVANPSKTSTRYEQRTKDWLKLAEQTKDFICNCEAGKGAGKTHGAKLCYYNDRWLRGDEAYQIEFSMGCENRVTKDAKVVIRYHSE